ncbi:MAG: GDP-mannose 4,6-dehydratase, partial [Chthoniobacterales bacterium]
MNLLVTGGAGFIGGNFVRLALRNSDWKVGKLVNLDLLTYAGYRDSLADLDGDARHVFVEGDIGDVGLASKLLREHKIDAVLNFAAESHVDRSIDSPEPFITTNVLGTQRLLDATRGYW